MVKGRECYFSKYANDLQYNATTAANIAKSPSKSITYLYNTMN